MPREMANGLPELPQVPDPALSSRLDCDHFRQHHAERRRCFLRGFIPGRHRIDRRRLWVYELVDDVEDLPAA